MVTIAVAGMMLEATPRLDNHNQFSYQYLQVTPCSQWPTFNSSRNPCTKRFVLLLQDATGDWPAQGGAIGSIRFQPELGYGCNTGLDTGVSLLQPIKDANPDLSWADLIQLAGAVSIEEAGGPKIPLRLGRLDATAPEHCTPDGRLPVSSPTCCILWHICLSQ